MNRLGIIGLVLALASTSLLRAGTTLSKAAIKGDVAQIQACLTAGEDPNEIDKWGWTPLMWAVYYKYVPAVQCLLEHKANPNIESTLAYRSIPSKSTPLMICAYWNMEEIARLLLKAGANPELSNDKGKKAIDYATDFRFQPMVDLLSKDKPAPKAKPQPAPEPITAQAATQPKAASSQAAQDHPAPVKKPVKKAPAKKLEAPKKSEPPAIK